MPARVLLYILHAFFEQLGGAGREANVIFVLPPNVYVGPPGRGDFLVSNFHPGLIPKNLA